MTVTSSTPKLFQPIKVGNVQLSHRVVFAPSTRLRNNKRHAALPIAREYYRQRSGVPGSLIIHEGAAIAAKALENASADIVMRAEARPEE